MVKEVFNIENLTALVTFHTIKKMQRDTTCNRKQDIFMKDTPKGRFHECTLSRMRETPERTLDRMRQMPKAHLPEEQQMSEWTLALIRQMVD